MAEEEPNAQKPKARDPTLWERFKKLQKNQPSFLAELRAIGREGVKDVRHTMMNFFFKAHETPHELGTPLAPTQLEVNRDRGNVYGTKKETVKVATSNEPAAPTQDPPTQDTPAQQQSQEQAPETAKSMDALFDGFAARVAQERDQSKGMER